MRNLVKSPRWLIAVRCPSCRHRGVIAEADLPRFGVKPGAPVVQFVKRLRCSQCGSVMAQRTTASRRSSFLFVRPGPAVAALQPAVGGKEVIPHAHDCIGRFFKIEVFGGCRLRNNTSSCLKSIALKGAGLQSRH